MHANQSKNARIEAMNEKFLSPYNPQNTEASIYAEWEKSGFFSPDACVNAGYTDKNAPAWSMVMPPPNVTGVLHMGHALMLTVQDVLTRFHRMRGYRTLWIPGTDHAAIATQSKVEKEISKKEGKSRYDLGREELLKRIEDFAEESKGTIQSQIRTMGASCDWSREAFTLDEKRSHAVRTAFKRMYDEGLIYRGERIVNWDPKGQTTIADDEIVYKEEKTKFYYLKYGPFTIGTARPETKFGDKYVVMHPDDSRYKAYEHGQKISVDWINGPVEATIIKDSSIDMEFGTGVMTITPAHSVTDFDLAEKYNLEKEQIIDLKGRLLPTAQEFSGMKISEVREKLIEKLHNLGLVERIEDYTHNIATAERTGGIIEPQILKQWFVAVNKPFVLQKSHIEGISDGQSVTLKEIMRLAVETGAVNIIPNHFDKTYFHWIDNLRDWCISRQIWYGHRIPVWYQGDKIYCDVEAPQGEWEQDPDTLDTWFSSALWTFSTLGWPENTEDLRTYHPTALLETGYEILFFWVARMILMSGFHLGEIPFKTIYLHGTVRDSKGEKMSKSLGNGIDPIDIAKEFGIDAGRMALISGTAPGTDSRISNDKIKGYKHFANKIWNATRFVLENTENALNNTSPILLKHQEYIDELKRIEIDITEDLKAMRIHLASEKIYHYFWHRFADQLIEECKSVIKTSSDEQEIVSIKKTLYELLRRSLILIHPFMPFVTEEIWQALPHTEKRPYIMIEPWPIMQNHTDA